jgi:transcriptional regulator with XRE-family HTH domain
MEDIRKRVAELRETLGLTQTKFAEYMGLTSSSISLVEAGKTNFADSTVRLVCLTFGVHEKWLRNGEGPMFTEDTPGQKQLVDAFRQLTPQGREAAIKIIETILDYEAERGWNEGVAAPIEEDEDEKGGN